MRKNLILFQFSFNSAKCKCIILKRFQTVCTYKLYLFFLKWKHINYRIVFLGGCRSIWVVWPMKMLNVEIIEYEQPERSLRCTRMSVLYLQKHGYVNMHKTCISGIMSLRSTIHTSSHWYGPTGLLIMPTTKHTEAGAAWLSASAERPCNKTQRDSDDTRVIRRVFSPQTTFYLSLRHVSQSGLSHTQNKTLNTIIQVLDG